MKELIKCEGITRRDFLKKQVSVGVMVSVAPFLLDVVEDEASGDSGELKNVSSREALYYENVAR